MTANVEIETAGIKRFGAKARARREALEGREAELRQVFQVVGKEIVGEMRNNIARFTPGGVPDLGEKYKLRKQKLVGHIYPILWRTGVMVSSMYSRVFRPGTVNSTTWTIRIGFAGTHPESNIRNAELARIHMQGEGHAPKRDFGAIRAEVRRRWTERILYVVRRIRGKK